jgi:hypothetical protein
MVGGPPVGGGFVLEFPNVIVVVFELLFTVTITVAVPAVPDVRIADAFPPFVIFTVVLVPVSVKVPRFVLYSTAVPFGTA